MKAALYARQSLDVTEGIERQLERARALASARGWLISGEFTDNDTSASKARGSKTAWARMLASDADVVVAVDVDRLLRSINDLVTLMATGKKVVTVDGEIDLSTADGEFRATMLAGIARFEVRRKSERQKRANAARASRGQWVGGRRPFGFEADGVTLREREADAVRDAFRSVLSGLSLSAVARKWNSQGLVTGQARQARSGHAGEPSPWTAQSVRLVLTNPRYVGRVRYRGEIQSTPAVWPAIVDESTFEAVQAVLADPSRRKVGRAPIGLLTGLAVCGVEGCGATAHAGGNARRGVRGYRCSGSLGHFARMADPIDKFVEDVTVARLSRPDARELLTRTRTVDTDALHVEALGLRERLDSLSVAFADAAITGSQLRAGSERIRTRLAAIEGELADVGRVDVLGDLVAASDVRAVWETYEVDRKREVIATLMRVTLYPPGRGTRTFRPETVGIDWLSEAE